MDILYASYVCMCGWAGGCGGGKMDTKITDPGRINLKGEGFYTFYGFWSTSLLP